MDKKTNKALGYTKKKIGGRVFIQKDGESRWYSTKDISDLVGIPLVDVNNRIQRGETANRLFTKDIVRKGAVDSGGVAPILRKFIEKHGCVFRKVFVSKTEFGENQFQTGMKNLKKELGDNLNFFQAGKIKVWYMGEAPPSNDQIEKLLKSIDDSGIEEKTIPEIDKKTTDKKSMQSAMNSFLYGPALNVA